MMFPAIDQQRMRHHFSEHAGEYDVYARVQKRVASRLLELAVADPFSGPVLDVGTGTGEVARRFCEKFPGYPVAISDIAHDMTRVARTVLPGALAVDCDAQSLPFCEGSFGLILSSSVFQWIGDLPAVFSECRRVLQPGGRLSFAMFCEGTLSELRDSFRRALEQCQSGWPFHFQAFPEPAEVEFALRESGFVRNQCFIEMEREYHPDFNQLMVGLKRIGAQNVARSRPSGLFPRRVLMEMKRLYIDRFQTDAGLPASYGVLYGTAIRDE